MASRLTNDHYCSMDCWSVCEQNNIANKVRVDDWRADFIFISNNGFNLHLLKRCGLQVPPGQWFWTFNPPKDSHIEVYLHYVRGPSTEGECTQFFKCKELLVFQQDVIFFHCNRGFCKLYKFDKIANTGLRGKQEEKCQQKIPQCERVQARFHDSLI